MSECANYAYCGIFFHLKCHVVVRASWYFFSEKELNIAKYFWASKFLTSSFHQHGLSFRWWTLQIPVYSLSSPPLSASVFPISNLISVLSKTFFRQHSPLGPFTPVDRTDLCDIKLCGNFLFICYIRLFTSPAVATVSAVMCWYDQLIHSDSPLYVCGDCFQNIWNPCFLTLDFSLQIYSLTIFLVNDSF